MDLELICKWLLIFAAGALALIPIDAMAVYLPRTGRASSAPAAAQGPSAELDPEASYLREFEGSALFGYASGISAPALQASLAELAKDYRLKGVVLMDEAEAILEDAKTQKTVFVKIGEQVGDLTVKEIKEGFVVLSYVGEEIRLEIL